MTKRPIGSCLLVLLATFVATVVSITNPVIVAADGDGLRVENEAVWFVDPNSGIVHVTNTLKLTNTLSNTARSRPYYVAINVVAPIEHLGAKATSGGTPLRLTRIDDSSNERFTAYRLDLPRRLFAKKSMNVEFSFDLLGGAPRSPTPIRVNPAFVGFDAFVFGDPGLTSLRVVIPKEFTIDGVNNVLQRDPERSTAFGADVYSIDDIDDPDGFDLYVSAFNESKLIHTLTRTATGSFEVLSWPSDPQWPTLISTQIKEGIPALEKVIGTPWPNPDGTKVVQSQTPLFYGYEAWFNDSTNQLDIAETLDQSVTLHELSHAWFNRRPIDERWIAEGFAEAVTRQAMAALAPSTDQAVTPKPDDFSRFQLSEWDALSSNIDILGADRERYGYETSDYVIDALYQELGQAAMSTVLAWLERRDSAYAPARSGEVFNGEPDWRYFLDVLEEVGASQKASDLIRTYVAAEADLDELDARDAARAEFAEFAEFLTEMGRPNATGRIPDELSEWDFETATVEIAGLRQAFATLAKIEAAFTTLNAPMPDLVDRWLDTQWAFELNPNLDSLLAAAEAVIDVQQRAKSAGVDVDDEIASLLADLAVPHSIAVQKAAAALSSTIPATGSTVRSTRGTSA